MITLTRRKFFCAAVSAMAANAAWGTAVTPGVSDLELLADIEHRTFNFYWERVNHRNGLMADRWLTPSVCSITGTGFGLTAWPIGVERGWITRTQARDLTLRTLRFLEQLPQAEQSGGCGGYRGFYYQFIDMERGLRLDKSVLSTIDTTWLQMGMLVAQGWFDQADENEIEIRKLSQLLLDRTEWDWMQANSIGGKAISMGWSPENGFIERNWDGYNEGMPLYLLALGSGNASGKRWRIRGLDGALPELLAGRRRSQTSVFRTPVCASICSHVGRPSRHS